MPGPPGSMKLKSTFLRQLNAAELGHSLEVRHDGKTKIAETNVYHVASHYHAQFLMIWLSIVASTNLRLP